MIGEEARWGLLNLPRRIMMIINKISVLFELGEWMKQTYLGLQSHERKCLISHLNV